MRPARNAERGEPAEPERAPSSAIIADPSDVASKARTLVGARRKAANCHGCPLYARATQTVFGEGSPTAAIMMVGEQPGDEEDQTGRPFVGPAGRLLDSLFVEAGIERRHIYLTNAVKHFKWIPAPRGKRRLHAKPAYGEVEVCRAWLDAEVRLVRPRLIVCLGATAAKAFRGAHFSVTAHRGEIVPSMWAPLWMATHHPSLLLRIPDQERRSAARAEFVEDLRRAVGALARLDESSAAGVARRGS